MVVLSLLISLVSSLSSFVGGNVFDRGVTLSAVQPCVPKCLYR